MAQLRAKPQLLVLVFGAVAAAWLLLSRISPIRPVVCALVAVGLLIAVSRLLPRHRGTSEEDQAWRPILSGIALIAGFALVIQTIQIFVSPVSTFSPGSRAGSEVGNLVFSVGCLAACAPIYRGLVHWNRVRTGSTDPGEMLNGFGAFFIAVAIGNLLRPPVPNPLTGLKQWQEQASVGTGAAIVILLGTAVTVAMVGGLLRDARIWLVIAAIGVVGVGQAFALLAGEATRPSPALWLFAATMVASCALIAPGTHRDQALNHEATVVGAMTVLLGGVVVVALNGTLVHHQRPLASFFAATGLLIVGFRMVRVIQDLADVAQIRREALTDDLTGLPNRRALLSAIDGVLPTDCSGCLLILDLERFKAINDRYGHRTGDLLLQHVAGALAGHIPPGAVLARLGGDEFAVLLKDADTGQAMGVAHSLAHAAIPLRDRNGHVVQFRVNIGVATIDSAETDGGELLRRADTALDQAKTSDSGVCEYDRALDTAKHDQLSLIDDLQLALEGQPSQNEQIVVYYQPQVRVATGVVVGAEALVRWAHPRLGLLTPDKFIDLAEQNALMPALTARVMRQATGQAGVWRAAGYHLRVSVNISATYLNNQTLLPLIDEVLGQGLDARDLVLELTETSLMSDPEQSLASMKRLAERGVGVSIDDYGTGYSSLSYLNDLPATELKIDRSFTSRIVTDPRTAAIVAGTVELAHRLGIRLVAEGIEDQETLTAMKEIGCDETQGYIHSRPLPATLFLQWLQAQQPLPLNLTPPVLATKT